MTNRKTHNSGVASRVASLFFVLEILVWIGFGSAVSVDGAELLFSDFNRTGFDYRFGGFTETRGSDSVRVTNPSSGWGGGGVNARLDLTPYADGRFVVDYARQPDNLASSFTIEIYDNNGVSGKWPFSTGNGGIGETVSFAHSSTLSNPPEGVGNFANLDLSNITRWQVLGEFGSPGPFDISFDNLAISTTIEATPVSYPGRDADASWRMDAANQIDQIRKADLNVRVVDQNGMAIPGAAVGVEMQQHEFGFGSAVQAQRLGSRAADDVIYRETIRELFNVATIENNLKWPAWEGDWGRNFTQAQAIEALEWLQAEGIEARGHNLIWPGESNLPNSVDGIVNSPASLQQQAELRTAITERIADVAGATDGLVRDWDVVNEPRVNHDVMDILPEGNLAMVSWFQQAADADPDARLYLNEFGILPSGGQVGTGNQLLLLDTLNELIESGAPIDGVGLQSHFSESDITGPEQIWEILDLYEQTGLDIQITEYDLLTDDPDLQADYMRDFLTAVFAHESVEDFVMWGFYEDAHWRPPAAIFDSDWNLKSHGQAFIDLVFDEWWTSEDITTDASGESITRGFKGDYELTASYEFGVAQSTTNTLSHTLSDDGQTVTIQLDVLLGDLDGDGEYGCGDIDSLTSVVASAAEFPSFDLNGDGQVDDGDVAAWRSLAGSHQFGEGSTIPLGDANFDGLVNADDLAIWRASRFQSGPGWCGGDFNSDGIADVSDFNVWNTHRGANAGSTVPEPAGPLPLLFLVGIVLMTRRHARQR